MNDTELELELEDELESGSDTEALFEDEDELEFELEDEFEDEGELEDELEDEFEFEGEEFLGKFFKKIGRGVKGFVKRAAPVLKAVARTAAPLVGTAIGGPAGAALGGLASRLLKESEYEFEGECEGECEGESEAELEAFGPTDPAAELMAATAARKRSTPTATALTSAATIATMRPSDQAALRAILPHMIRGTEILTRILRKRAITRPAVRVVPTIMRRSTKILKKRAAAGKPVTRAVAGRVVAAQTRKVLGSPQRCARAMARNVQVSRAVARRRPIVRG
jgi:hypothetical protein